LGCDILFTKGFSYIKSNACIDKKNFNFLGEIMASSTNNNLKVPYEIGVFIASLVPCLDSNVQGDPWAVHKDYFKSGPGPSRNQMKQGLILEVINRSHMPSSIYTRYGQWKVLGSNSGSFDEIFEVVQKTLKLRKIEELSTAGTSYWAIQSWDGQGLEEPIKANEKAGEFIPYEIAIAAYNEFKPLMLNTYQ
jgi:hypothetical protein